MSDVLWGLVCLGLPLLGMIGLLFWLLYGFGEFGRMVGQMFRAWIDRK